MDSRILIPIEEIPSSGQITLKQVDTNYPQPIYKYKNIVLYTDTDNDQIIIKKTETIKLYMIEHVFTDVKGIKQFPFEHNTESYVEVFYNGFPLDKTEFDSSSDSNYIYLNEPVDESTDVITIKTLKLMKEVTND